VAVAVAVSGCTTRGVHGVSIAVFVAVFVAVAVAEAVAVAVAASAGCEVHVCITHVCHDSFMRDRRRHQSDVGE